MSYHPRNDYVVIRMTVLEENPAGLAIPQGSIEGKRFHVVAIGPKVEDLNVGDRVLMIGTQGQDYALLPNSKDLILIKETNVVLIYGK